MQGVISKKQLRDFGIIIGFGFPLIIGLIIPYVWGDLFRTWTLFIGIPTLFIGLTKPKLLFYPYIFWMRLGHLLGWINSHLVLGLVFIIVLLPIALIMKCFNYDPLRINKTNRESYRENINNKKINFNRIF